MVRTLMNRKAEKRRNFTAHAIVIALLVLLFYGIYKGWDGPPERGPHPKRVDPRF